MRHACMMDFTWVADELNAELAVELIEQPSDAPARIINRDQHYIARVTIEMDSKIKHLICGKWCISVAAEGIGKAGEGKEVVTIPMDNCNNEHDTVDIVLPSSFFAPGPDTVEPKHDKAEVCGDVFKLVVTAIALDNCEGKPIGIAGFCTLGPVMVYG